MAWIWLTFHGITVAAKRMTVHACGTDPLYAVRGRRTAALAGVPYASQRPHFRACRPCPAALLRHAGRGAFWYGHSFCVHRHGKKGCRPEAGSFLLAPYGNAGNGYGCAQGFQRHRGRQEGESCKAAHADKGHGPSGMAGRLYAEKARRLSVCAGADALF